MYCGQANEKPFKNLETKAGSWKNPYNRSYCWCLGALLLMGVSDSNGGIRIMYPLFGISNQLIAAVALTVLAAMVVRKGYFKWLWIVAIPLVWDVLVTFAASWEKIFSTDVNVGYFAAAQAAQKLISKGGLTATALTNANATVWNSTIQGVLSAIFLISVVILFAICIVKIVQILKSKEMGDEFSTEEAFVESSLFETSSFWASPLEHKVLKEKKMN